MHGGLLWAALGLGLLASAAAEQANGTKSWEEKARELVKKYQAGEYAEALAQTESLVREAGKFRADDSRRAWAYHHLGLSYHELGRHMDSARALEQAVSLRAGKSGNFDAAAAVTLNHLAVVYAELGQYAKAERAIHEVREMLKNCEEAPAGELAKADVVQSMMLLGRGRLREAEELSRSALKRESGAGGKSLRQVAFLWNGLGNIMAAQQRWEEAEADFARALDQTREVWGNEHPNTAKVLINLAGARRRRGRAEDAERIAGVAIEMLERLVGPDHPAVGAALRERAEALRMLKRGKEAKALARRGAEILERFEAANQVGATVDAQVLALRASK
jgi:tetratricopeptide (TPR) repeat protein